MSEADQPSALTPNDVLAGRIVNALRAKGLLAKKHVSQVELKLQTGRGSESDWQLWAEELVIAKEAGNAKASSN